MRINSLLFTKIVSILGYITFSIWLYFVFFYIPQSTKHDFANNTFYSIMDFVILFLFFLIHIIIFVFLSLFAIEKQKYTIIYENKITKGLIKLGIILNFIPLILFSFFLIYLIFFYA